MPQRFICTILIGLKGMGIGDALVRINYKSTMLGHTFVNPYAATLYLYHFDWFERHGWSTTS
jgi:hypothetical protein